PNVPAACSVSQLVGNWHLNSASGVTNDVLNHEYSATFKNVASGSITGTFYATDLNLDNSAFPYAIHQEALVWPYVSSWIVRGEYAVNTPPPAQVDGVPQAWSGPAPAITDNGIIC